MNEKAYAKAVARRLACSKARRDEFVRDLESDIASSLADGETWEQVERRLGDPRDVAREFNEALSERELAAGRKRRRLRAAGIAAAAAVGGNQHRTGGHGHRAEQARQEGRAFP